MERQGREYDIVLCAGNPPQILVSQQFLLIQLAKSNGFILRDRIDRALEKLHRVHRTLSNAVIPVDYALALRRDARIWIKTTFKPIMEFIPESEFEVTWTCHVKDKLTGAEFSISDPNADKAKRTAIQRLALMIISDEKTDMIREGLKDLKRSMEAAKCIEPVKVIISTNPSGDVNERLEY
jgi:hypothetical protein